MASKQSIPVNWEKIGVYVAIMVGFLTVIFYLFQIKDDMSLIKERVARVEENIK